MVWAPVFRGTPPKPLWIERGGLWRPAWSEDPCGAECCGITCEGCFFPASVVCVITGITGPSPPVAGCDCSVLNGTLVMPMVSFSNVGGTCSVRYEFSDPEGENVVCPPYEPPGEIAGRVGQLWLDYFSGSNTHNYTAAASGGGESCQLVDTGVAGCPGFYYELPYVGAGGGFCEGSGMTAVISG